MIRFVAGAGIGLALCTKIAKSLNGSVELERSVLGQGSVFRAEVVVKCPDPAQTDSQIALQRFWNPAWPIPIIYSVSVNEGERTFLRHFMSTIGFSVFIFDSVSQLLASYSIQNSGSNESRQSVVILLYWKQVVSHFKELADSGIPTIVMVSHDYIIENRKTTLAGDHSSCDQPIFDATILENFPKVNLPLRRRHFLQCIGDIVGSRNPIGLHPQNAQNLSSLKMLIVEDNKVNQKVLVRMLSSLDLRNVMIMENGQEAVTFFENALHNYASSRDPIDVSVVLMDIQMPVRLEKCFFDLSSRLWMEVRP
jgi:hypothetical protein